MHTNVHSYTCVCVPTCVHASMCACALICMCASCACRCASYLEADWLVDVRQDKLLEEAWVLAPEEPDVWYTVEHHGKPL